MPGHMPGYMRPTAASVGRQKNKINETGKSSAPSSSTPELDVKEKPILPIVDQQTTMLRQIIDKNEENHDNAGSYFKIAVSNFELKLLVLKVFRFAKRKQIVL